MGRAGEESPVGAVDNNPIRLSEEDGSDEGSLDYDGKDMQLSVAMDLLDLLKRKSSEYGGDNTGLVPDIMVALYGGSPGVDHLDDYPYVVRIVEKLLRIARGKGNKTDGWIDICGMSLRRLTHMKQEGEYEP